MSLLDTPYKLNGREPSEGLDCFQLVRWWWLENRGVELPDLIYGEGNYPAVFRETLNDPSVIGWTSTGNVLEASDGNLVVLDLDGRPHCGVFVGGRLLTMTAKGLWCPHFTRVVAYVLGVYRRAARPELIPNLSPFWG